MCMRVHYNYINYFLAKCRSSTGIACKLLIRSTLINTAAICGQIKIREA